MSSEKYATGFGVCVGVEQVISGKKSTQYAYAICQNQTVLDDQKGVVIE